MADFKQPGSDGTLSPEVNEWRRGLVYTAKPELPSELRPGQEYRISVGFKRNTGSTETFTGYGQLYQRVSAIAKARISQLRCAGTGTIPRASVMCHGWRCLGETNNIATAFLTMELTCSREGDGITHGEEAPSADALTSPGGATLEMLTRFAVQRVDEFYSDFDFTDPSTKGTDPVTLSYGESVSTSEEIDFQPFVERAERLASFYHDLLHSLAGEPRGEPLTIIRRQWFCVTNPNLVTVQIQFQR